MKKIAFLIMILMAVGLVSAASIQTPMPIAVKLSQPIVALVTMTNLNTGEVIEQYTSSDGGTIFEWANSQLGAIDGAKFRVETLGLVQEFNFYKDNLVLIPFEVGSSVSDRCVITRNLAYGEVVQDDSGVCQVYVKAPDYVPIKCKAEGTVEEGKEFRYVDDNGECDITVRGLKTNFTLEGIIIALFALFAAGTYVKISKPGSSQVGSKIVNGKLYHSHKNVSGYHNPQTVHGYMPHKKGELYPAYSTKKNSDGKYDYLS